MDTSSLAPVFISPVARRMNGFQLGKSSKWVISSQTRLAEELISISLESCFENTNENHHSALLARARYIIDFYVEELNLKSVLRAFFCQAMRAQSTKEIV
jgi:c-di-GMP-related signal transduction protein